MFLYTHNLHLIIFVVKFNLVL